MLYESPHLRLDADDGVATLWVGFPGRPINGWDLDRLAQLGPILDRIQSTPSIEILVIRSSHPDGFCAGFSPHALASLGNNDEAAALFSRTGQAMLNRLAGLDVVSVAYLEGPCRGPGWELALACDYRLAVAGPDAILGPLPEVPMCWGCSDRLRRRARWPGEAPLYPRQAARLGAIDDACSPRRGSIELRTLLDRLQRRPRKRQTHPDLAAQAEERRHFREVMRSYTPAPSRSLPFIETPLPGRVGIDSDRPEVLSVAVELLLRGRQVQLRPAARTQVEAGITAFVTCGRITPLEADQARSRIGNLDTQVDWYLGEVPPTRLRLTTIFTRLTDHGTRPGDLSFHDGSLTLIDDSRSALVASWCERLGYSVSVSPVPALRPQAGGINYWHGPATRPTPHRFSASPASPSAEASHPPHRAG